LLLANQSGGNDSDPKIICKELYRHGLLKPNIFKADEAFGRHLYKTNIDTLIGYHLWAKPVVKMMRKSKTVTRIVYFFAKPWSEEMAYRMGAKEKGNCWGNILMFIGLPICGFLGKIINLVNSGYLFEMVTVFLFSATIGYKIINNRKNAWRIIEARRAMF